MHAPVLAAGGCTQASTHPPQPLHGLLLPQSAHAARHGSAESARTATGGCRWQPAGARGRARWGWWGVHMWGERARGGLPHHAVWRTCLALPAWQYSVTNPPSLGQPHHLGTFPHLIVAAAACVQLATSGTDQLAQPTLISGMDVLITALDLKGACLPLRSHPASKRAEYTVGWHDQQLSQNMSAAVEPRCPRRIHNHNRNHSRSQQLQHP